MFSSDDNVIINVIIMKIGFKILVDKAFLNDTSLNKFIESVIQHISIRENRENLQQRMENINKQHPLSPASPIVITVNKTHNINYNGYKDCSLSDVFSSSEDNSFTLEVEFRDRTDY